MVKQGVSHVLLVCRLGADGYLPRTHAKNLHNTLEPHSNPAPAAGRSAHHLAWEAQPGIRIGQR